MREGGTGELIELRERKSERKSRGVSAPGAFTVSDNLLSVNDVRS